MASVSSAAQNRAADERYQSSVQSHGLDHEVDSDDMPSFFVRALYDFESNDASSLSFRKGALIEVLTQLESGWWDGLLDNQIRGWFPSNYVEPISDQEAEMELMARSQIDAHYGLDLAPQPALESDSFSRLGFGAGFDGLQALIKGDGIGNSDAFSQLAEAAMSDPRRRMFDDTAAQLADLSLNGTTSPLRRDSTNHASHPDASARTTAAAVSASLAAERERARAASTSLVAADRNAGAQAAALALNRPRAATGSITNDIAAPSHWVSRTTERGQTVYHNTRTGATSTEHPSELNNADSAALHDGRLHPQPMLRDTSSGPNSSADSRKGHSDSQQPISAISRRTSLATSESRPSSANSSSTAILVNSAPVIKAPQQNAVQRIPVPASVPKPWRLRLTDDEKYFFFVHRLTGEIRWDYADPKSKLTLLAGLGDAKGTSTSTSTTASSLKSQPDRSKSRSSVLLSNSRDFDAVPHASALRLDSDDSDLDGDLNLRLPGKSPKMRHIALAQQSSGVGAHGAGLAAFADHPVLASPKAPPQSLLHEENVAYELQRGLAPAQVRSVSLLVRRANEAIRQLAAIATEQIGTNGLSEADRAAGRVAGDNHMPRLTSATASVVASIREVLYATGCLALSTIDLLALAKLLSTDQPASAVASTSDIDSFSSILGSLHGVPQLESAALQSLGVYPKDALASTPAHLHPIGRKLNAVISKLVLSSRQVIDHTVTLASSPTSGVESTMTDLDADVFSKLYQCRQRLREDALELMRTLQAFSSEAERARSTALGTPHSRGWLRRVDGSVESDIGLNGVGVSSFGSGMAAGWRGNGFVLPSKHEVVTLRTEVKGGRPNPFDAKRDSEAALVHGAATLRRLPTGALDQTTLVQIRAALSHLGSDTDSAKELAKDKVSPSSRTTASLQAFTALNALVENLDLASSLDVDGPAAADINGSAINERNAANAARARDLMRRFVVLKQAAYDASATLLVRLQESLGSASSSTKSLEQGRVRLYRICASMVSALESLAKVAEEQLKDASPFLGARALVYGSEDGIAMSSTGIFARRAGTVSNGLDEELEEMARYGRGGDDGAGSEDTEFMYLGPGIVVPNGPRSRSGSRASPATAASNSGSSFGSPVTSFAPSGRGGVVGSNSSLRQRSTSVTTGGSIRSMQSYPDSSGRLLSRRGTLIDGRTVDEADEDGNDSRGGGGGNGAGGGKVRRMLGDDAPLSSTLTVDSEASGNTTSTRRREDELPWFLEPDYMGDDIVIAQDGSVKGATLEALLARLTMHNSFDASFNNTFLMTYRSFTTTQTLLDLLTQRFHILPPAGLSDDELTLWSEKKQVPIRLRVFNVLKSWLETHFYEGEDDIYLEQVRKFAVEEMGEAASMKAPSQHLLRLVERRQGEGEQQIRKMVLPHSAPPPILPKNIKKLKLLEIDPLELARQLTLIESRLYNAVKPAECLGLKWTKPGNEIHARHIMESINTHNRISAWVAETILQQEDLKRRAALIKHFISIADRCRSLNNFSGMWAIVSALSTAPIHRLRRTWDAVNQKQVAVFESLETLMSASRNWLNYRETIRSLNPPCVPFLGRYLGDLTFIEDGNRDRLKENDQLINFGKRQKTAEVIREITIHQSTPYNLIAVPALESFIAKHLVDARSADELYEQSLLLEPREREDEKIARLLQESGFL
ncbi:hypothetical protein BCV70DRAFT_223969 [Testicularia cyperi]|uniref:Ras GEF n=1 Tax=Testicularia cyperi TaxID=1882483 RepID=A0A317XNY3_9BASI|nr:hypothetical protein BCV70DRAFT_223969 [Testicularia cyperi]